MGKIAELLPVGSVVIVRGSTRKLMIMGILQQDPQTEDGVYDYLGVTYPVGFLGANADNVALFNSDDVTDVIFKGYHDEERERMLADLQKLTETE